MSDGLTAACGPLTLIASAGICNSLRAKVDAARQSIDRGNANAAGGQAGALLRFRPTRSLEQESSMLSTESLHAGLR